MGKEEKIEAATPHVYQAIAAVQGKLAETGIAKSHKASGGGASYQFRGIDDVYAALSPLLAEHKLNVIPRVLSRETVERQTKNGYPLYFVTVHAEFDFVSAVDGTCHTASTFGEAMDSSDKATNKAMSAAYKYAAFMTFAIPTEGDNDADAHSVAEGEVQPKAAALISDDQRDLIQTLAESAGKPLKDICQAFKVASLKGLTERQGEATIKRLQDLANETKNTPPPQSELGKELNDAINF